jgi:hypothetical protein
MKLIMDRVIPVADATGAASRGATQIVVNVQGMEANIALVDEGDQGFIDGETEQWHVRRKAKEKAEASNLTSITKG